MRTKVFYISLLKPALKGVPLKKKIKINANKDKYNVKEVMDLRKGKNTFKYFIKWLNYSPKSNLWELVKNLKCLDLVVEFH